MLVANECDTWGYIPSRPFSKWVITEKEKQETFIQEIVFQKVLRKAAEDLQNSLARGEHSKDFIWLEEPNYELPKHGTTEFLNRSINDLQKSFIENLNSKHAKRNKFK